MTTKNSTKPEIESVSTTLIDIDIDLPKDMEADILTRVNVKNTIKKSSPYHKEGYQYVENLLGKVYDPHKDRPKLIFISPFGKKNPFVRLLIDPSDMQDLHLKVISNNIKSKLNDLYYVMLFKAINVHRLNISYDIKNIAIEDLVFHRNLQRNSSYQLDADGKIKFVCLGTKDSNLSFHIYDKNLNDSKKGTPKSYPVLRIEAQINPKLPLHEIKKIKNPFKGITIYKLSNLVDDESISTEFGDSIHRRGLTGALQSLPKKEQKETRKLIKKHAIELAPSKEVFELWLKEYEVILKSFDPSTKLTYTSMKELLSLSPAELKKMAKDKEKQSRIPQGVTPLFQKK